MENAVTSRVAVSIAVIVAWLLAPLVAAAEPLSAFPSRPVRLIVPYPANGSNDLVARLMAVKLAERWKQNVIVENKVGASGILASEYVANSPPDGYAILVGSNSATTIAEHIDDMTTSTFKGMKDLVPLTNVLSIPAVLVVNPKLPVTTLSEFIDYAKKNPGKLNFSSSGAQSGYYLSMVQFQMMTGTKMVHVPYAGLAPAELAVMAGDVEAMLDSSLTSLQYIRDGRMRLLGLASVEPWPLAPDYPKISALLPGFQSLSFIGLFAGRGTPADLAAKLTEDFRAVLNEPELRQKLLDLGALPSSIGTSTEDFRKFLAADSKTWGDVIAAGKGATAQ
jgi:tripartite-type tricarboxylate transporter receptor subunit TctC